MRSLAIICCLALLTGCTAAQIDAMNRGLEKQRAQPGYYERLGSGNPYKHDMNLPGYTPIQTPKAYSGSSDTPSTRTYLINTDDGMVQKRCRDTNSSYSYCY